jgi:hypothetical protein
LKEGPIGKYMIPVILIHKGYSDYLKYTILQSIKNNYTYLISDTNPNINENNFQYVNMDEYNSTFNNFKKNYVHLSTNPHDYELFCYQRWFILLEFMKQKQLDVVFYIDSDVLLFVDVNKEWEKFNQFEVTLLHRTAALSSYFTIKGLTSFCNFLENTYSDKNGYAFKKISSHYHVRQECGLAGGVCDMTLFEYFHYSSDSGGGPGRVGEMMHVIDDSVYDHNVNAMDQDFEFIYGKKDFKIKNGIPYVYSNKLKKDIKFNSLHFQGNAKNMIKSTYEKL